MQEIVHYKNATISYSTKGKGTTVVLLHGFLENSSMWNSIVDVLSTTNRVICIDLPGHGNSDCIGYVHSMEMMAEVVAIVLKKLQIRRVILVGHSMGGYVSLVFAEKNPSAVKGLCLMNSTSLADDDERKLLRTRANKFVQNNFKGMVQMSFTNLFSKESKTIYTKEIRVALQEALKTPLQGYMACQEGMKNRPNREHVLQNAVFKKLQIVGEKDEVLDVDMAKQESVRTQTPLIVLSNGHMSHIENKQELIVALKKFVRSC